MNEELGQIDADLKGLFVETKLDEVIELLGEQTENAIKEITEYNWGIIKKYYDTKNFELLFKHLKFVAYTCLMTEYAHQIGLLLDEEFEIRMVIYNDIYELKGQQE